MKALNLRVVVEQEALHNQDVDLLVGVGQIGGRRQRDTVRSGKLHRVLNPAFYRVGHGLHIQRRDNYKERLRSKKRNDGKKKKKKKVVSTNPSKQCNLLDMCLLFASY